MMILGGIVLLFITARICGLIVSKLHQPKMIGEVIGGILLGPFALGVFFPEIYSQFFIQPTWMGFRSNQILNVLHWIGLLLLMFVAGLEARRLFVAEHQNRTKWLLLIGTPLPLVCVAGLALGGHIDLSTLMGPSQHWANTLLVLGVSISVTSIPFISRIFLDLGIQRTPFAAFVLGIAVVEDLLLWLVLAVAMTVTGIGGLQSSFSMANPILLAFLAGYILSTRNSGSPLWSKAKSEISRVSLLLLTPIYFSVVGQKLIMDREISGTLFLQYFLWSSALAITAVFLASLVAGFRRLPAMNLAVTMNARGGPGIALATMAYDASIISGAFFTTLVGTAILTSMMAGAWLQFVLNRKWPLL